METIKDLDLVRAVAPRPTLTRADGEAMPTMAVDFSVFGTWYEIDSWFEGTFMERTMPGSFRKTIKENGSNVKVLFDHGMDYQIGNKVLGPIEKLSEEATGPHAEVPLLNTSYNRDLLPGLEAGLYGSSFRFRVIKEEWNDEPGVSDWNPKGLPERSIKEVKLMEFGPVTFPANPDSTAGVRALTDQYYGRARARNPDAYSDLVARARTLHGARAAEPTVDPDDDSSSLIASVDAVLDEAVELFSGLDLTTLPPDAQQGIALVNAAEALADQLMDLMGITDPDDLEEMNSGKPAKATSRKGNTRPVDTNNVDEGAEKKETIEPLGEHSKAPFIPTVGSERIARKAAYMRDYLSIIVKGSERYERGTDSQGRSKSDEGHFRRNRAAE